jgi:chemotaxis response regulator CheB
MAKKVLCIDDSPTFRQLVKLAFEPDSFIEIGMLAG